VVADNGRQLADRELAAEGALQVGELGQRGLRARVAERDPLLS